jgi:MFS family permease
VAEIFFLHERAYRLGIYTLLLLGGKNIIPLVSAAIVQSLGWRWVFWMVAIVVAFCFFLIFFFVPETFWDRTPTARGRHSHRSSEKLHSHFHLPSLHRHEKDAIQPLGSEEKVQGGILMSAAKTEEQPKLPRTTSHVGFAADTEGFSSGSQQFRDSVTPSPWPDKTARQDYFSQDQAADSENDHPSQVQNTTYEIPQTTQAHHDPEKQATYLPSAQTAAPEDAEAPANADQFQYTDHYRNAAPKSYVQTLKPWNGRLAKDKWVHVMIRPFILYAYPAVLWSSMVYALAVGWLIVLSESVAHIYRDRESYNFTALQVGLVYISPFIGGILGTAVAGKISDIVVRFMARKNDGVYEPEYRLVMAVPIAITTTIGLMGFGWSAEEKDNWIVPTVFFGVISFGCSLASTTAVTFVVDSYRVYAGEALVTLNFSKSKLACVFRGIGDPC